MLATDQTRVQAGGRIALEVVSLEGEPLPERFTLRATQDGRERLLALELRDRASSRLLVLVEPPPDAVQALTGSGPPAAPAGRGIEPPLSANEPMYFVVGTRGGTTTRFQLSFKYRLFDRGSGWGADAPWLSGLYFGYTQNSIWNLSAQSRPFRDTSYRPSLFWRWRRAAERDGLDGARVGLEHESNGKDGPSSRSLNTAFVQPRWRWALAGGKRFAFEPKLYAYLEKSDNPDIQRYRGYADWNVSYGDEDVVTRATARVGTAGKGSLLVDFSKRTRAVDFGPVSGYFHVQFFTGYGEDLLDYNVRRVSQLRFGFAIVP